MHFQPNNDAGSRAQGLKLTPFIGDGNSADLNVWLTTLTSSLKLTPFIGDGNSKIVSSLYIESLRLKLTPFIGDGNLKYLVPI